MNQAIVGMAILSLFLMGIAFIVSLDNKRTGIFLGVVAFIHILPFMVQIWLMAVFGGGK